VKVFGRCLNPRVLAGATAIGLGVFIVAPALVSQVLPLLAAAICPLSMLLMMGSMKGAAGATSPAPAPLSLEPPLDPEGELAWLRGRLHDLERGQGDLRAQIGAAARVEAGPVGRFGLPTTTVEEG